MNLSFNMTLGYFGLVLHGHIPYCKRSGTWPAGEEWLFEAILETYIPMLNILRELKNNGINTAITINITPILADQLADEYMKNRFSEYMENLISRAKKDIKRFENHIIRKQIADFHLKNFEEALDAFYHDYYRDILGTFKWLQEENMIEIITSAATHGFLPLLESDSGIFSQIQIGVDTYKKYFNKDPLGFWLPECAYRPKEEKYGIFRESIDYWLNNSGIKYFFVEAHGILDANIIEKKNNIGLNTNFGYKLKNGLAVFGRNKKTSRQVWDAQIGYPGDFFYREFHKKDHQSGLHYWRITDKKVDKENKELYDPVKAQESVNSHANHFISSLIEELKSYNKNFQKKGIIISPFDFELFGHWWMEGIAWLKKVFEFVSKSEIVSMTTISDYVSKFEAEFSIIEMGESSWGEGGHYKVWKNKEHIWIWPYINSSMREFEKVLEINPNPNEWGKRLFKQMAREMLLMEGSDWPFLLYTKQAKDYANQRFHNHHQRFNKLLWAAKDLKDKNRISLQELETIETIDTCFQDININYFKKIQ